MSGDCELQGINDDRRPYFTVIEAYAKERFQQLARKVVARLQRREATGLLEGKVLEPRTLWDEVSWLLKEGYETATVDDPFNTTINIFCGIVLEEVRDAEAVLLTCIAAAPVEDQDMTLMPGRDDLELRRVLRAYVLEKACARDMTKFEVC
ncbi:hypothetical protein [Paracoccus yeei]|uniref:hypothetical protein n=1 Tax=Paracoccus yeei TaxID=147645 RepID=UPI0011C386B0|nr:hypothetical protein [Paracoccus yeei]